MFIISIVSSRKENIIHKLRHHHVAIILVTAFYRFISHGNNQSESITLNDGKKIYSLLLIKTLISGDVRRCQQLKKKLSLTFIRDFENWPRMLAIPAMRQTQLANEKAGQRGLIGCRRTGDLRSLQKNWEVTFRIMKKEKAK